MKYKMVVDGIMPVFDAYCKSHYCSYDNCDLCCRLGPPINCARCANWVKDHSEEAAELMGAEIVEEEV